MNAPIAGGKRPVELELDADLVDRASRLTRNLSATVEHLLEQHLAAEEARRAESEIEARAHAEFTSAFIEKHGFWGEEFRTF
jgi:post-segregation antitoxin (ccd killing protein)